METTKEIKSNFGTARIYPKKAFKTFRWLKKYRSNENEEYYTSKEKVFIENIIIADEKLT